LRVLEAHEVQRVGTDHPIAVELSRRLRRFLLDYAYPGNIRELRNIIYRVTCLAGPTADIEHLPANIRPASPTRGERNSDADGGEPTTASATALSEAKHVASDEAEREFLERGLQEVAAR
jgi:DNA-binding NtrC family response regulator